MYSSLSGRFWVLVSLSNQVVGITWNFLAVLTWRPRIKIGSADGSGQSLYLHIVLIKQWLHNSLMRSLNVLADPTRQRIVEMLATGALPSGEIARRFDVSAPAISQHLKTLRDAKLVRVRAQAQKRFYELDAEGFDELNNWLNRIRSFWTPKLDALEQELRK